MIATVLNGHGPVSVQKANVLCGMQSFFTQGFSQYHALCVTGILMLVVEYTDMKSGTQVSMKRQCDV